jgi:hypothetical protein
VSLDYAGAAAAAPRAKPRVRHAFGAARYASRLFQSESAMAIVAVYQFRAKFRSKIDPMDAPPKVGLSREGLLMLRQEQDVRSDADAIAACERRAAFDAVISAYGVLELDKLQLPQNKDYVPLYEQALAEGSSLTYNPNSAPPEEESRVTQWGFKPQA